MTGLPHQIGFRRYKTNNEIGFAKRAIENKTCIVRLLIVRHFKTDERSISRQVTGRSWCIFFIMRLSRVAYAA